MTAPNRYRCYGCGWRGDEGDLLTAPSPFEPEDEIVACPNCKQVSDDLVRVCDEPGCWKEATMGTPTRTGYRRTCFTHRPDKGEEPC